MFKAVLLLKRRPGMTRDDFVAYYEGVHAKLGERLLPTVERYMRRYLKPFPGSADGQDAETDYDVITELWFRDRPAFEAAMAGLGEPATAKELAQDEERLFDRSKIRFYTVEEFESTLAKC